MTLFTYHLVKTNPFTALKALAVPPKPSQTPGLVHAECMTFMTLGSKIFSPSRMVIRQVAFFAQWENESAIDTFLTTDDFGKLLAKGWHTRLQFLRQWGTIDGFTIPPAMPELDHPEAPVVAVTLARMKLPEIPRFIRWGRPVEMLVRDHPGTTLALASIRLPRTVSTFSVWKSQKEMVGMVRGTSPVAHPGRHSAAMKERERKDFHFQFTTLRFKPLAEFGSWEGRDRIIPGLNPSPIQ